MESNVTDKPVPRDITALLSDERLILRETQRAVTPFGGIAVFISFLVAQVAETIRGGLVSRRPARLGINV